MVHELYAYLRVDDSARAIDFYRQAFGATEIFRLTEPSGRIGHAELDFNGTTLMISDAFPEFGMTGPQPGNGSPVSLHLHVDDADRLVQQALDAGAMLEMAPQDQFYGERTGVVIDPFGHRWMIGHEIEKLTPQEMQRRYTDMMQCS
jgi:PhnB protein